MNKMQERDKFNTSCREHSVEITIDHVTRHIAWKRDDCPVCRVIGLEQQLQQAHREGWERAKREAKSTILDHFTCCDFSHGCDHDWCNMLKEIADAIASMEYKEKAND